MDDWEEATDAELVQNALNLWANYVETRSPLLSGMDMAGMGKRIKPLSPEQMKLVLRLRKLSQETDKHYAAATH